MIRKGLALSFITLAAMAEETPIITHSEFSYINTKGNTNTTSLAFEGTAKKQWDQHIFRLTVMS